MSRVVEERAALDGAFDLLGLDRGNTNPYATLGVHTNATRKEVQRAFIRKAMELHPDKRATATTKTLSIVNAAMQLMNNAQSTLRDPEARRQFDQGGGQSQESGDSGAILTTTANTEAAKSHGGRKTVRP